MRTINELSDLAGKHVVYRPDYNVPMKNGEIQDDFRITSTFPTLDYLMEKKARIVILSHMGRPDGHVVPELELMPIAERLADQYPKRTVQIARKIEGEEVRGALDLMGEGDILVMPNVRFYPEEEQNNTAFAHKLADLGDIYVNDAFSCDHRAHASTVGVAEILPAYAGFVVEKEIINLGGLIKEPAKPFVVVMGGAKVSDKIEVIKTLATKADHILVGGAMANTFLLAKGEKVGNSLVEKDKLDLAEELMETLGEKLVIAEDYIKDKQEGDDFRYLDIGPKAIEQFQGFLKDAKTIFWNGDLGYVEDPAYAKATEAIATYIAGLEGVASIIAGGDTVETVTKLNLHDKFTFVSTGGGAALELLAGKSLPGIAVLEAKEDKKAA